MFARWGERSGLFSVVAPRDENSDAKKQSTVSEEETRGGASESEGVQKNDEEANEEANKASLASANDEELSSRQQEQLQEATNGKKLLLEGQKLREIQAMARDDFCKYQRARYLHKASQTWFDSYVVGVHYDDGVGQPYYTIVYQPREDEEHIEKQTTRDRLAHTAWDEQKTLSILSSRGK